MTSSSPISSPTGEPTVINGRYEIRSLSGNTSWSNDYRARDLLLDRDVIFKALRPDLTSDRGFIERFRAHAQAAANLSHPALASVFDWGRDPSGFDGRPGPTYYLVAEEVGGRSTQQLVDVNGAMPIDRALHVLVGVTSALSYANRAEVIHGGVSPENITVTTNGVVKVADIGLGLALGPLWQPTNDQISYALWRSPEVTRGETADGRTDVYNVGLVGYFLLTGRPPFPGDSAPQVAERHRSVIPPAPSKVNPRIPKALESIIGRALAKNPSERFQSAAEMRTALIRFRETRAASAPTPGPGQPGLAGQTSVAGTSGATGAAANGSPGIVDTGAAAVGAALSMPPNDQLKGNRDDIATRDSSRNSSSSSDTHSEFGPPVRNSNDREPGGSTSSSTYTNDTHPAADTYPAANPIANTGIPATDSSVQRISSSSPSQSRSDLPRGSRAESRSPSRPDDNLDATTVSQSSWQPDDDQTQILQRSPGSSSPGSSATGSSATGSSSPGSSSSATGARSTGAIREDVADSTLGEPRGNFDELDRLPKRSSKGLVAVLLLLLAALGGLLFLLSKELDLFGGAKASIIVPNVTAKVSADAESTLSDAGLNVEVRDEPSESVALDIVIGQSPLAGVKVPTGAKVILRVSSGIAKPVVPRVIDETIDGARAKLARAGFQVELLEKEDDTAEPGTVINQEPRPDTEAAPGSKVIITVATSSGTVEIPDVTQLTPEDARLALTKALFRITVQTEASQTVDQGKVIRTEPPGGKKVDRGAAVVIIVSGGNATQVPDLRGKTQADAEQTLNGLGLKIDVQTRAVVNADEVGTVITQTPSVGKDIDPGATVTVRIGVKDEAPVTKAPKPTPVKTVETTPPTKPNTSGEAPIVSTPPPAPIPVNPLPTPTEAPIVVVPAVTPEPTTTPAA
jgi:eukaryotic-like serine/threonine-protein kinase